MLTTKERLTGSPQISLAQQGPKVYFKNLDGLRFIAALMVLLQHMSDYKHFVGDVPNIERPYVRTLGAHGVTLFFVLSGYLIFYLLFSEKKITNTVSIRKFYVRRILRIWPLYFGFGIIMIVGIDSAMRFLGMSIDTPVSQNLFFLFTFSINLQLIFMAANKGIIELYWSVCIEEQLYLFAPWLVRKGSRIIPWIIGGLIACGIATKFVLSYLKHHHIIEFSGHTNPITLFTTSWFDAFGLGILGAYIYFNKHLYGRVRRFVENKYLQLVIILLTVLYVTNQFPLSNAVKEYFFSTIPALLFAYIILAASTGNFIVNLERPILSKLGRISYGMYVFHAVIAQVTIYLFLKFFSKDSFLCYEVLFPITCLLAVVVAAWLSYELYEKHFLKMKKQFTLIQNQRYI